MVSCQEYLILWNKQKFYFLNISVENSALENVDQVVLDSSSKKCSFCNHFGASLVCKMDSCSKIFHFPCATASGAFQELSSLTTFCSQHLGQATLSCEGNKHVMQYLTNLLINKCVLS